mgnify:CR=1 FL=1|tara:strand:+ start:33 stop:314 length:282 start_codon:yes stop_codon:yes gene_type:complete
MGKIIHFDDHTFSAIIWMLGVFAMAIVPSKVTFTAVLNSTVFTVVRSLCNKTFLSAAFQCYGFLKNVNVSSILNSLPSKMQRKLPKVDDQKKT